MSVARYRFLRGFRSPLSKLSYGAARIVERASNRLQNHLLSHATGLIVVDGSTYDLRDIGIDLMVLMDTHEPQTHQWIREQFPHADIMLDVGGFSGAFCLRHRTQFQRVIAFEPSPANYDAFRRNIALSNASNVEVVNAAVSDRSGLATLFLGLDESTNSLENSSRADRIEVAVVSLDDHINPTDDASISLIKVDVEGAEIDVLKGASRILTRGSPWITLEATSAGKMRELVGFMALMNYRLYAVLDGGNYTFRKDQGSSAGTSARNI